MSYDHNIYVGWYAILTPTTETKEVQTGVKTMLQCTADAAHKQGDGKFCRECGAAITRIEGIPVFSTRQIQGLHHFINETDPDEIAFASLGHATLEDIQKLQKFNVVFPEFMPYDCIVMFPGYAKITNVSRKDGDTCQMKVNPHPPTQDQIDLLIKVVGATEYDIQYGIVHEVH